MTEPRCGCADAERTYAELADYADELGGEVERLRGMLSAIGLALVDPDDYETLLGALFSEHGMDRAREVLAEAERLAELSRQGQPWQPRVQARTDLAL